MFLIEVFFINWGRSGDRSFIGRGGGVSHRKLTYVGERFFFGHSHFKKCIIW